MSAGVRDRAVRPDGEAIVPRPVHGATRGASGRARSDLRVGLRRLGALFSEVGAICGELADDPDLQLAELGIPRLMAGEDMPGHPAPRLLSVRAVADLVGVDEKTVRRWRARGMLPPAVTVGGVVRWEPDVIQAWIAGRTEAE